MGAVWLLIANSSHLVTIVLCSHTPPEEDYCWNKHVIIVCCLFQDKDLCQASLCVLSLLGMHCNHLHIIYCFLGCVETWIDPITLSSPRLDNGREAPWWREGLVPQPIGGGDPEQGGAGSEPEGGTEDPAGSTRGPSNRGQDGLKGGQAHPKGLEFHWHLDRSTGGWAVK